MKKVFVVSFEVMLILLVFALVLIMSMGIYSLTVLSVPLDLTAVSDKKLSIDVYNSQGLELKENNTFNGTCVDYEYLPEYTKQAFLSIEDKQFYEHHGINLARMTKAFFNNLSSFSLKEGASTITQQLIKNTHLSNAKTFSRKLNEIKLAISLEKKMPKEEILENYLNIIYFGNNCYGIEDASQYYFSKPATTLDVAESATLAGIIKSPNRYSLTKHPELAVQRRNLVLSEMKRDGYLNNTDFSTERNKSLVVNLSSIRKNRLNSYSQSAIDEAVSILKMPEKQIALGEYKIYTFQDLDKQLKLDEIVNENEIDSDYAVIDIDAKTGGVLSYIGASDYKILEHKRQIGSIIKPILVYAPALNENILTPASQILDEPLTIEKYTPQNVSGTYAGYVSTRYALSKSLNIPAVKTASYVGLKKIENYATKMNLELDKADHSYSLALGGLTYGFNLKNLTGAYSVFTNNGNYIEPKFINYITDKDGNIVYKSAEIKTNVFRDDTAFLITDMLKTCAQSGTARKLADLPFQVAAKTGTVGTKNGNTDAYNMSFTTEDIVGVWFGNMDNKFISTVGGNQPTALAKNYYKKIYSEHKPKGFSIPSSVETVEIDTSELENNHTLVSANDYTPEKYKQKELFSRFNLPKENISPMILKPISLNGTVENNKAILKFNAVNSLEYKLYKNFKGKKTLLKTFEGESGQIEYTDSIISNQKIEYFVEISSPYAKDNRPATSNTLTLINANNSEVIKEKWYI